MVRIKAANQVGQSIAWATNSLTADQALVEVVPHKPPQTPSRDALLTSSTLLKVNIEELQSPETGGAQILSYHLQYDDSSQGETWTDLLGYPDNEVLLTKEVTSSI